jgi:cytochrome b
MTNHHAKTRIWDLPTRVFHWALAFCVVCLLITGFRGGDAMPWHYRFGYCVLTLLMFRLVWGVVGGKWSRFASFVYAPSSILRYMKGQGDALHSVGHNPLGAFSVFAILALLLVQVSTGLISDDEISAAGPLTKFVSNATVSLASSYHVTIGKVLVIVLVITHLAAIVFYLYKKRENLIKPMLHGDKLLPETTPASADTAATRTLALAILLACAAAVYWLVSLGG